MCLIVFANNHHERYKLVLAANRDEFYKRPTQAADFWGDNPDLLAGRDLEAGGTWMGLHKDGRFGALTNYRDPSIKRDNPPSRGDLIVDYLSNGHSAPAFLNELNGRSKSYNGFNLLVYDQDEMFHFSNTDEIISKVDAGVHGLSNALLDTPWPKLERAKSDFASAIDHSKIDEQDLFHLLKNDYLADDAELPQTGIPYEWEKAVSSVFIKTANYGTRCSTLLFIDHDDQATFVERRYDKDQDNIIGEKRFSLKLNSEKIQP